MPSLFYAAQIEYPETKEQLLTLAKHFMLNRDKGHVNDDIIGLRLLALYGLTGAAAYPR